STHTTTWRIPNGGPWCFCFFFQAEDGIRDGHVTGVQTCALPISDDSRPHHPSKDHGGGHLDRVQGPGVDGRTEIRKRHPDRQVRSEERRVGKECRSRWSGYE